MLTIILGLYGLIVVALIPGIIVSYFMEISKVRTKNSVAEFLDKLERLPELTQEELQKIAKAVRKNRNKL